MVALEEFILTVEPDEGRDDEADGIGKELRERVARETAIFNDALEAVIHDPTPEALDALSDAADRLMRAVGRVPLEAKKLRGGERGEP